MSTLDRRTSSAVRYLTGARFLSEMDATDCSRVARLHLRNFEREVADGDTHRALDHLQDAREMMARARREVRDG